MPDLPRPANAFRVDCASCAGVDPAKSEALSAIGPSLGRVPSVTARGALADTTAGETPDGEAVSATAVTAFAAVGAGCGVSVELFGKNAALVPSISAWTTAPGTASFS